MPPKSAQEDFLDRSVLSRASGRIGVAVSGGGDSVALLHLLNGRRHSDLAVVTVDHGLRPESADEAARVASLAAKMGLPHDTLRWDGQYEGNLQDAARRARQRLIRDWARANDVPAIATGHTADDQAETFLMRLSRGSGLDGLGAMEPFLRDDDGLIWLRPMLHIRRAALRDYLSSIGATWDDDPSNEDDRFDRVKMRDALGALGRAGISVDRIAKTTKRLRSAKSVLFISTRDLARTIARLTPAGELQIEIERLVAAQQPVRLRLLSEAVRFIGAAYYAPRAASVTAILDELGEGRFEAGTLSGTILRREGDVLMIRREPGAVEAPVAHGALWDARWVLLGPAEAGTTTAALGEQGLEACGNWRATGLSREALLTSPAAWAGETLQSAPLLGIGPHKAEFRPRNPFFLTAEDDTS